MAYKIDRWAENEDGWDTDTGNPGIMYVANAIQAWSTFQKKETTIAEASQVFNLDPKDVRAAIETHPWMYLSPAPHAPNGIGTLDLPDDCVTIEHEGE